MSTPTRQPEKAPSSHLFTLRLWQEDLGEGRCEWRGEVKHIASGKERYFRDWATLPDLLKTMLPSPEPEATT